MFQMRKELISNFMDSIDLIKKVQRYSSYKDIHRKKMEKETSC